MTTRYVGDSTMLEIVCFDPFVLDLRKLSPDDIELHPNPADDIYKESLPVFVPANLRIAILPLSSPGRWPSEEAAPAIWLPTLVGSHDLRDQYLRAIATDYAIGLIAPFSTDAKAALNGR